MYEKILSGRLDGSAILFIDTDGGCSQQLLLSYVLNRLQQQVSVTFVPSGQLPDQLPGQPLLKYQHLWDRPGSWRSASELATHLEGMLPAGGSPAQLMVLDDVSCLAHWLGVTTLCQLVQQIRTRGHQMVLSVCEDAISEEWLRQLRHYADHAVTVYGTGRDLTAATTSRSRSGKVETAVERVFLSPELQVLRVEPCRPETGRGPRPATSDPQPDPSLLTTFRLQLSEQERQSRSRLVLPYLRPEQDSRSGGGGGGGGGGEIFYQPDAADDWDEEDPDDDLDI